MSQYIIKRFLTIVPVLVGISIIVFGFIHLIPGDPAVTMLGERATPESRARLSKALGLDEPIWVQYLKWMQNLLTGHLGLSLEYQRANSELIGERLLVTLAAQAALGKGIKEVVFDRGSSRYHGVVKELAEAARKAGLKF